MVLRFILYIVLLNIKSFSFGNSIFLYKFKNYVLDLNYFVDIKQDFKTKNLLQNTNLELFKFIYKTIKFTDVVYNKKNKFYTVLIVNKLILCPFKILALIIIKNKPQYYLIIENNKFHLINVSKFNRYFNFVNNKFFVLKLNNYYILERYRTLIFSFLYSFSIIFNNFKLTIAFEPKIGFKLKLANALKKSYFVVIELKKENMSYILNKLKVLKSFLEYFKTFTRLYMKSYCLIFNDSELIEVLY